MGKLESKNYEFEALKQVIDSLNNIPKCYIDEGFFNDKFGENYEINLLDTFKKAKLSLSKFDITKTTSIALIHDKLLEIYKGTLIELRRYDGSDYVFHSENLALNIECNNLISFIETYLLNDQNIFIGNKVEFSDDDFSDEETNPFPRIFKNRKGYEMFQLLSKTVKNKLADYSFIFRKMHKDGYIYSDIKESAFRAWLQENYSIILDKLKLLDYSTTKAKECLYSSIKNNIQLD